MTYAPPYHDVRSGSVPVVRSAIWSGSCGPGPHWCGALLRQADELDWESPVEVEAVDLVVGSDLIYLHELHAPLVQLLRAYALCGARAFLSWEALPAVGLTALASFSIFCIF